MNALREGASTGGRTAPRFELVAGAACLDFVNTRRGRLDVQPRELLRTYDDFILFGEATGILPPALTAQLRAEAARHATEAAATLTRAVAVREAIHAILAARLAGLPPPADAVDELNRTLAEALSQRRIQPAGDDFVWAWEEGDAMSWPLWMLTAAAAELLTSPSRASVRVCATADCGVLFLDTSRSGRRRWCTMKTCGNRAKVRQFRTRRRPLSPS